MHTYYQSPEYENMAEPGTFAALMIIGDDDGPHFVFISSDQVIADVPVPCGVALEMSYALGRSGKHAIRAAERRTDDWETETDSGRHAEPLAAVPPAVPVGDAPAIAMTPYGRREIGPGEYPPREFPAVREVRGEPGPAGLPTGHTRPLPCPSGSRLGRAG